MQGHLSEIGILRKKLLHQLDKIEGYLPVVSGIEAVMLNVSESRAHRTVHKKNIHVLQPTAFPRFALDVDGSKLLKYPAAGGCNTGSPLQPDYQRPLYEMRYIGSGV